MKSVRTLAIGIVVVLAISVSAEAISFHGIGFLSSSNPGSGANGVSGDGNVVVGWSRSGSSMEMEAIRWEAGSMVGLDHLSGGMPWGRAYGASIDGSVVVGEDGRPSDSKAFRWTDTGGMVGLPGSFFQTSVAYDVSSDGSVVVGRNLNHQAGYWAGTPTTWSLLCSGSAYGVSPDGSTIVGVDHDTNQAFRWTDTGGLGGLGGISGGSSEARDVSADGSVVVGTSNGEAFRWTPDGGMEGLGGLTGDISSTALAVSADGSIIVGKRWDFYVDHAFIWDSDNDMQDMRTYLVGQGLDMSGWRTLYEATGISDDGLTIVGTGEHMVSGSWVSEGWIATLDPQGPPPPPPIPEPLTMLCVFGGVVGLGGYVRRRLAI